MPYLRRGFLGFLEPHVLFDRDTLLPQTDSALLWPTLRPSLTDEALSIFNAFQICQNTDCSFTH